MPQGTIKKKTDKGFGFITTEAGTDLFFHSSNVEGSGYEGSGKGKRCRTPKDVDRRDRERRTSRRSKSAHLEDKKADEPRRLFSWMRNGSKEEQPRGSG